MMRVARAALVVACAAPVVARWSENDEAQEMWVDNHNGIAANPAIENILKPVINAQNFQRTITDFVGVADSRYTGTAGNRAAREDLARRFYDHGLVVTEQQFDVSQVVQSKNVIGALHITGAKDVIVVGAHYDTMPKKGKGPGADDNGSGVAAMLLVMQAVTAVAKQGLLHCNFMFVGFSAEEVGLQGSEAFAKELASKFYGADHNQAGTKYERAHHQKGENRQGDVRGVFIFDQVGVVFNQFKQPDTTTRESKLFFETSLTQRSPIAGDPKNNDVYRLVDTLAHAQSTFVHPDFSFNQANTVVNWNGFASDHMSFLKKHFPAVMIVSRDDIESEHQFGHSDRDVLANINPHLGASAAWLAAVSACAIGEAQSLPLPMTKQTQPYVGYIPPVQNTFANIQAQPGVATNLNGAGNVKKFCIPTDPRVEHQWIEINQNRPADWMWVDQGEAIFGEVMNAYHEEEQDALYPVYDPIDEFASNKAYKAVAQQPSTLEQRQLPRVAAELAQLSRFLFAKY